jgi:hypothetical protein
MIAECGEFRGLRFVGLGTFLDYCVERDQKLSEF